MENCESCCFKEDIVGGDELVSWCKIKNEHLPYPKITGVFCKDWKEKNGKSKQNIPKKKRQKKQAPHKSKGKRRD